MAYNETPPDMTQIGLAYPYARVFLLLHGKNTSLDSMAAWGDLVGIDRAHWFAVLTYYASQDDEATPPPLVTPGTVHWMLGYYSGRSWVNAPTPDQRAHAAQWGTTYPFLLAGIAYYAYDLFNSPSFPPGNGLEVLLNLVTHL